MDPLAVHDEHGDHDSKNVLLTICDNSQESDDEMMSPNYEGIQYEVHNVDGVLEYRFVNTSAAAINNNSPNTSTTTMTESDNCNNTNNGTGGEVGSSIVTPTATTIVCNTNNTLQGTNCQFFVINDLSSTSTSSSSAASRPCLISPKISTDLTINDKSNIIGSSKKRDEKRRATHNEVERRRRDKINQWIFKLRDLLPEHQEIINETTVKNKNSTSEYSKGGILVRACEYIRNLKEENDTFQECLKETETLRLQNATLAKEIIKLRNENEGLKKILLSAKIIKKSQKSSLTVPTTTIQTSSEIIDLQEFESS